MRLLRGYSQSDHAGPERMETESALETPNTVNPSPAYSSPESIPSYPILSHTWGLDDTSIQHIERLLTASQTLKNRDSWVDTCSVDKTNDAKFTESINAMFRWYNRSLDAYICLCDVEGLRCDERTARDSNDDQDDWSYVIKRLAFGTATNSLVHRDTLKKLGLFGKAERDWVPSTNEKSEIAGGDGAEKDTLRRQDPTDAIYFASPLKRKGYCYGPNRNQRSRQRDRTFQIANHIFDCVSILVGGGAATLAILNFNENRGTCPLQQGPISWSATIEEIHKGYGDKELQVPDISSLAWHVSLRHASWYLPDILRCPTWPVFLLAMSVYTALGIYHSVHRQPRFWAESGLLVVMVSIIVGTWYGPPAVFNSLVLGAFLSLVWCKILGCALDFEAQRHEHMPEDGVALVDDDIYPREKTTVCQGRSVF